LVLIISFYGFFIFGVGVHCLSSAVLLNKIKQQLKNIQKKNKNKKTHKKNI